MTKPRKDLSADALVDSIRKSFAEIHRWDGAFLLYRSFLQFLYEKTQP